jgi:hypothetical protein
MLADNFFFNMLSQILTVAASTIFLLQVQGFVAQADKACQVSSGGGILGAAEKFYRVINQSHVHVPVLLLSAICNLFQT